MSGGGIDDAVLQQIKDRADILEIIGSAIQIKKAGRNYLGLCPFHNEKSPSFNVNPDNQYYHCFGCGAGGDAISFVKNYENVDFQDAVRILADRYGIIIPESTNFSPQAQSEKSQLYELHTETAQWFQKNLFDPSAKDILEYLYKRGVTKEDIETFQIGYAPESWDRFYNWAKSRKYNTELLESAGLVVHNEKNNSHYDRFRNRIMFSIWNDEGKVVAFSGRVIGKSDEGAKYVNSPETPIFRKSNILYGLPMAKRNMRDASTTLLCEGQLDVIACHRAGFKYAVSSQGTAFTEEQAKKIKRYSDNVIIAFDSDGAGKKAAFKATDILLSTGISINILNWGEGQDPDSLYLKEGSLALKDRIDNAEDFIEVFLKELSEKNDTGTPTGKSNVANTLIPLISKIPDSIRRSDYCQIIAERLQIHPDSLFRELNRFFRTSNNRTTRRDDNAEEGIIIPLETMTPAMKAELNLIELAITFEDLAYKLNDELPQHFITNTRIGKCLIHILDITLAGDWYSCRDIIQTKFSNNRDISARLAQPEYTLQTDRAIIDQAYRECLKKTKEGLLVNRRDEILRLLRQAPENSNDLKLEYQNILKQIRAL
jgi:DNA primase